MATFLDGAAVGDGAHSQRLHPTAGCRKSKHWSSRELFSKFQALLRMLVEHEAGILDNEDGEEA